MTQLHLNIMAETDKSTLSGLWHGKEFLGFVIEDGHNDIKIDGETRIPGGRYKFRKKTDGKFFDKYSVKYGHRFVIELMSVPSFTAILIHIGNTVGNTSGCLLPNLTADYDQGNDCFFGNSSEAAYKNFYNYIAPLMDAGDVWINIDRGQAKAA